MNTGTAIAILLVAAALAGCTSPTTLPSANPGSGGGGSAVLNGAGSTFVNPLMSKWSSVANQQTGVQVNYQSIGSGGGIKAVTDKTVQFAGSDAPLNAAQRSAAPGIVHIPESLGAVALTFNVPGVDSLHLTGPVLADIYLGKVKDWNDPAIAALNPGVSLPAKGIFTVHRSDGSGTTYAFTDYLSKVSGAWKDGPGKGTSISWPGDAQQIGAKGSEGVAGVVQKNPYALGYVESGYAATNHLAVALMQNKAGKFVGPTLEGAAAAAAGAAGSLPAGDASWEQVSINDAEGDAAYPIATFTYVLLYKDLSGAYGSKLDAASAKALVQFVWWAVHDGQQYGPALQYPALPDPVVKLDEATLRSITYGGQPLQG